MPYVEYDEVEAICSDCGRIFRSEEALAQHRTESHAGVESVRGAASQPPSIRCPDCDRLFDSTEAARVHRRRTHHR